MLLEPCFARDRRHIQTCRSISYESARSMLFALQKVAARGFTPIMTPDLVRDSVLEKCGFQPRMDNTQTYNIENSDLCLTGAQPHWSRTDRKILNIQDYFLGHA